MTVFVIKDDDRYQKFTAFYNRSNENYRTLIDQKNRNPVIIFKRKISHMYRGNDGDNGGLGRLQ